MLNKGKIVFFIMILCGAVLASSSEAAGAGADAEAMSDIQASVFVCMADFDCAVKSGDHGAIRASKQALNQAIVAYHDSVNAKDLRIAKYLSSHFDTLIKIAYFILDFKSIPPSAHRNKLIQLIIDKVLAEKKDVIAGLKIINLGSCRAPRIIANDNLLYLDLSDNTQLNSLVNICAPMLAGLRVANTQILSREGIKVPYLLCDRELEEDLGANAHLIAAMVAR
jgi:hypothetical protein